MMMRHSLVFCLVLSLSALGGCSNGDDTPEPSVVGTWSLDATTLKADLFEEISGNVKRIAALTASPLPDEEIKEKVDEDVASSYAGLKGMKLAFNEDGSCLIEVPPFKHGKRERKEQEQKKANYTLSGSSVTIKFSNEPDRALVFRSTASLTLELEGDTLTLKGTALERERPQWDDGTPTPMVFRRN